MTHDDTVKALQASNEVRLKLRHIDVASLQQAADTPPFSASKDTPVDDSDNAVAAMLLEAAAAEDDAEEDVRVVTVSRVSGQRLGMTLLNVEAVPYPIVHQVLDGGLVQKTGQVYGNDVILKVGGGSLGWSTVPAY